MSISKLENALALAAQGFYVFPLRRDPYVPQNNKLPVFPGGYKIASRDESIIHKWWKNGKFNIGVSTEKYGESLSLIVVDIDVRDGKLGNETVKQLEDSGFQLPATYTVLTASGGRHLYFVNPVPCKSGANILGPGVDIKSSGGYVVGPGSEIPGVGEYTVIDSRPPEAAPIWLIDKLKRSYTPPRVTAPICDLNLDRNVEKAIEYLRSAREAISGGGGNYATYFVALDVKDLAISEKECLGLMWVYWNESKAIPPWDFEDLERIVSNAYKYGNLPPGAKLPEAVFSALPDEDRKPLTAGRFTLEYACDLMVETDAPYLIDGILDLQGSSVIYGDTNCGKTFVALDLAYHVFLGLPWRGYKTRKGGVLYIAAEGGIGMKKRVAAIRQHLPGADTAKVGIIRKSIDLFRSNDDMKAIIQLIDDYEADAGLKCELVIIDTFARALAGGNENAAQDVGTAVGRMTYISQERLTHVSVVHHTGKDKREMRGSSALAAAVENTIKITPGLITFEKQRDEEKPAFLGFRLKQVNVGTRKEDNKPITSCIVEPTNAKVSEFPAPKLTDRDRWGLDSLDKAIEVEGISIDEQTVAISDEVWWRYYQLEADERKPGMQPETKRKAFIRARTTLQTKGRIDKTKANQWYIL